MKRKTKFKLNSAFSPIVEHSYMVSLKNSKEFLAVFRRYGRLFSRFIFTSRQVSSRLQLLTKLGNMLIRLNRIHGSEFVVKYLKACNVSLQRYLGGKPLKSMREIEPCLPLPGLTKAGLPKFIPLRDQRELGKLTVSVVRWYLTIFSVYRIISCPPKLKLESITNPFTGSPESLDQVSTWLTRNSRRLVTLLVKVPKLRASLGLERIQKASPTYNPSWKGCLVDVVKWMKRSEFFDYAVYSGSFSLYYDMSIVWKFMESRRKADPELVPAPGVITNPEWWHPTLPGVFNDKGNLTKDSINLGQLSFKEEAAGKVRVFAMVDVWTQSILKPLHDALFRVFRFIPNDSTHNQDAGFKRAQLKAIEHSCAYCYDLSSATDRLPIQLQAAVLDSLWGINPIETPSFATSFGQAWVNLLTKREYVIPVSKRMGIHIPSSVKYSVGQPMGALSSWAMLNLTHHLIVQYCAERIYGRQKSWFEKYEVLGDDIVIFDPRIASLYFSVMETWFGVSCNPSKSLIAPDRPVIEFAKRVSIGPREVSAFSWRQARALDSLFGRASMAYDLLSRKIDSHPMRVLKTLTGRQWSNIDSYLYSLLFITSNIVKQGKMPFQVLCDYLIDPKNPFRFIGGRIIGNIKAGPLEDVILRWTKDLPIQVPHIDQPKIAWYSRLFDSYARGYLTDRIAELLLEMSRKGYLDKVKQECGSVFGPPIPGDILDILFYWERYRVTPKIGKAFDILPIEDLLVMYDEYMQMKRDFEFYKLNTSHKPKLDNGLKLLSFLERSKKVGIISIPLRASDMLH